MTGDQKRYIGVGAGAVVVLGAFLPWIKVNTVFGSLSANGVDDGRDGIITIPLGVIGALIMWAKPSWRWLACICGVAIVAIALYDIIDVDNKAGELEAEAEGFASVSVGSGLYLTLVAGAFLALFAAIAKPAVPAPVAGDDDLVPPPPPLTPPPPPHPPPGFAADERPSGWGG